MAEGGLEKAPSTTIVWRIENLSRWNNSWYIDSSFFRVKALDDTEMLLRLYPRGGHPGDKHVRFEVYFRKGAPCQLDYPVDCDFSFLDSNQLPLCSTILRNKTGRWGRHSIPSLCPLQEEVFVTLKSLFLPDDTLTVRCRFWKSTGEHTPVDRISRVSRVEVRETSFPWIIDVESLQLGRAIAAPVREFFKDTLEGYQLNLSLVGDSIQDSSAEFEMIMPYKVGKHEYPIVKVSIRPSSSEFIYEKYGFHSGVHRFAFVSRQKLIAKMLTSFKRLVLFCNIVHTCYINSETSLNVEPLISERIDSTSTEVKSPALEQKLDSPKVPAESNNNFDNLKGDFLCLYQEHTLSDFELRSKDDSFPVHKNILSARSPVFRAMFSSDMEESCSKSLDVPDLDTHTLNRLLMFLYTGTVEQLQWEDAAKLYYAAVKYEVSFLKQICSSTLRSSLAVSNVPDILVLADRHQDQQLTSNVHDFILDDFDDIMSSKEWESFMDENPSLAGRTTLELVKKKNQLRKRKKVKLSLSAQEPKSTGCTSKS